jgi:hypothetical protein
MTETQEYPLPTVHLNGTSKESLLEGNVRILSAINELREAIGSCQFHGRDYYIQDLEAVDVDAFSLAYEERRKHLNNIGDFEQYIEQHIDHIHNQ